MNNTILNKAKTWTNSPYDVETQEEILELINKGDENELKDRFYKNLEFGTGGLRGIIGAGTNRINKYTVGKATQGLANYIIKSGKAKKGVVIARDSRRFSEEFAKETAKILVGNGIHVYFFEDIMPTPLASFAVRELGAVSAVVITASHNPPEYNGYKVYWEDGGQIIPPHDKNIIEEVNNVESVEAIKKIDFEAGLKDDRITIIDKKIITAYIKETEKIAFDKKIESNLKILYTPIHGSGYKIVPNILKHFGFTDVAAIDSQEKPNGEFPTVQSPNPEEKETLSLAIEEAKKIKAQVVLATDPDADRMGVAVNDGSNNFVMINGNQIGSMLAYYTLLRHNEAGTLKENDAIIKTVVTTELQREIGESFNCKIDEVLTGFKWIAAKIEEYKTTGSNRFIFGGEESYGYLPADFVRDKDAVLSSYLFADMVRWLQNNGKTTLQFLDEIYIKYSLYREDLHTLTLKGFDGAEKISKIMENFRKDPPAEIGGSKVIKIEDYENKIKGLPASNVLQFYTEDGSKITMRPSGTEPKIKFYFSVKMKTNKNSIDKDKKILENKIEVLRDSLLKMTERA